jgi:hypothetical protein
MIAMINEVSPLWSKEFGPTHQNIAVTAATSRRGLCQEEPG